MSTPFKYAPAIFLTLTLIACGGQETNPGATPNDQNSKSNKALILGHWVSDCYPDDGAIGYSAEASVQEEYWFFENERHNTKKHYKDTSCEIERNLLIIGNDQPDYPPIQKATYYFASNQIANSGETFSMYRATNIYQKSSDPFLAIEWGFGTYIEADTLYIVSNDFQSGGGYKINFSRPFRRKSD